MSDTGSADLIAPGAELGTEHSAVVRGAAHDHYKRHYAGKPRKYHGTLSVATVKQLMRDAVPARDSKS